MTPSNANRASVSNSVDVFTHWRSVSHFVVEESDKRFANVKVTAVLGNGRRIVRYFASISAAYEILNSPIFQGRHYYFFGKRQEIKPPNGYPRPSSAG